MTVLSGFSFGASFRCVCHQLWRSARGTPLLSPRKKTHSFYFFFVAWIFFFFKMASLIFENKENKPQPYFLSPASGGHLSSVTFGEKMCFDHSSKSDRSNGEMRH